LAKTPLTKFPSEPVRDVVTVVPSEVKPMRVTFGTRRFSRAALRYVRYGRKQGGNGLRV
jgi:hypothetical protein